ncbi:MAG: hypothetical protein KG003_11415 [Bacteroidetes bacterium]|nr:hypothetical protein [Bacteroidota bacterium]
MTEVYIKIPKRKAELPAIIVTFILCFVGWAFHFGFFSWKGGFIWMLATIPALVFVYFKRRGNYFVQVNKEGISWRQSILSRYIFIPWNYIQRVDYLVFEINFMIRETGQVVSFPTSGIDEAEAEKIKQAISDVLGEQARSV